VRSRWGRPVPSWFHHVAGHLYRLAFEPARGQTVGECPLFPVLEFPVRRIHRTFVIAMGNGETTVEKESSTETAVDIPWNVVVHNDPVNLMTYVTMVFQRVFGYSKDRAKKHMLEVHQKGRSIVWTGVREPAESYVEQLQAYLLLATLEKAE
jgi:ATP-dependent Clp protease adaptor protein ClpS